LCGSRALWRSSMLWNWARTTIVTLHYKLGLLNSHWIHIDLFAHLMLLWEKLCKLPVWRMGTFWESCCQSTKLGGETFLNLVESANQIATVSESWARRDWSPQNTLCFGSLVCCNLSCAVIEGLNCLVNMCLWSPQISSQISSTSTYTSLSGFIGHQG
jgi:hypothetical protein